MPINVNYAVIDSESANIDEEQDRGKILVTLND